MSLDPVVVEIQKVTQSGKMISVCLQIISNCNCDICHQSNKLGISATTQPNDGNEDWIDICFECIKNNIDILLDPNRDNNPTYTKM